MRPLSARDLVEIHQHFAQSLPDYITHQYHQRLEVGDIS